MVKGCSAKNIFSPIIILKIKMNEPLGSLYEYFSVFSDAIRSGRFFARAGFMLRYQHVVFCKFVHVLFYVNG